MLFCSNAALGADSGATAQVKAVLEKVMEIQTRAELEGTEHRKERSALIRKVMADNFAAREMAKETLGENWDKLSAKQREMYQDLFTGLFQDSYTRMVLNFLKRETVEYREEIPEGKDVKVGTVIMRTNEHIPVDYILQTKGQRWYIRDAIVDGVSIVENYRDAFGKVIRTQGFETLIQKMTIQKKAGEDI